MFKSRHKLMLLAKNSSFMYEWVKQKLKAGKIILK